MTVNMIYKNGKMIPKIALIDNDDITPYGKMRNVGTPGINCDLNKLLAGHYIADKDTDEQGFKYCIKLIRTIA